VISIILQSVLSSFLHIGAATVSSLIDEIMARSLELENYAFNTQDLLMFCVNLRTNSDDFPIQYQFTGFNSNKSTN